MTLIIKRVVKQLLKKLSIIHRLRSLPAGAKASLAFAICSILQKGVQLFTVPLFAKTMTTSQYGQYNVFQTWHSIICVIATLNLSGGCFNNGMLKYPDDRDGFSSSMQGLSTIVTILILTIYLIAPTRWNGVFHLPTLVMLAMFVYIMFEPSVAFWSAKQRYEYKYVALVLFTLVFSVMEPAIGWLAISHSEEKGLARIFSVCLSYSVVGLFFYSMNYARGKTFFNKEYWSFALRFNLPLIPHYLSQIILGQSDRLMIEGMVGTSSVAVYSMAYNIGMIMGIFITSINASFVPWTFESMKKGNYKEIGKLASGLVMLMGLLALIPIIFAPEAIRILGTKDYLDAVWIVPPVALSSLMTFMYSFFANIEFYYENSKGVMLATVTAAVANIILNYVCIKLFGYLAAGFTTFVCYGLMLFMHYLFMRRIMKNNGIEQIYNVKNLMLILVSIIVLCPLFMLLYHKQLVRYLLVILILTAIVLNRKYFVNLIKQLRET